VIGAEVASRLKYVNKLKKRIEANYATRIDRLIEKMEKAFEE
jgi:hypothetical protein